MTTKPIIAAETDPNVWRDTPPIVFTYWRYAAALCAIYRMAPPPAFNGFAGQVRGYINHGRWVADCPFCRGAAQVVSRKDPAFWCIKCRNERLANAPSLVLFPRNADDIETILRMRDDPANRNWTYPESVQTLAQENIAHGAVRRI